MIIAVIYTKKVLMKEVICNSIPDSEQVTKLVSIYS